MTHALIEVGPRTQSGQGSGLQQKSGTRNIGSDWAMLTLVDSNHATAQYQFTSDSDYTYEESGSQTFALLEQGGMIAGAWSLGTALYERSGTGSYHAHESVTTEWSGSASSNYNGTGNGLGTLTQAGEQLTGTSAGGMTSTTAMSYGGASHLVSDHYGTGEFSFEQGGNYSLGQYNFGAVGYERSGSETYQILESGTQSWSRSSSHGQNQNVQGQSAGAMPGYTGTGLGSTTFAFGVSDSASGSESFSSIRTGASEYSLRQVGSSAGLGYHLPCMVYDEAGSEQATHTRDGQSQWQSTSTMTRVEGSGGSSSLNTLGLTDASNYGSGSTENRYSQVTGNTQYSSNTTGSTAHVLHQEGLFVGGSFAYGSISYDETGSSITAGSQTTHEVRQESGAKNTTATWGSVGTYVAGVSDRTGTAGGTITTSSSFTSTTTRDETSLSTTSIGGYHLHEEGSFAGGSYSFGCYLYSESGSAQFASDLTSSSTGQETSETTESTVHQRSAVSIERLEFVTSINTNTVSRTAQSLATASSISTATGNSSGSSNHQLHNAGSYANHRYTLTAHQYSEGGSSTSAQTETFSGSESASGSSLQTASSSISYSAAGTGYSSSFAKTSSSSFSSSADTEGETHTTSSGNYSLLQSGSYANELYSLPCVVQTNTGQSATTYEFDRTSLMTQSGSEHGESHYLDANNRSDSASTSNYSSSSNFSRQTEGSLSGSSNRYQAGSYLNNAWNLSCVVLNESSGGSESSVETATASSSGNSSGAISRRLTMSEGIVTVSILNSGSHSASESSLLTESSSHNASLHQEGSYANDRWTIVLAQAESTENDSSLLSATSNRQSNWSDTTQVTRPSFVQLKTASGNEQRQEQVNATEGATSSRYREGGFSQGKWHLWEIEETGNGSSAMTFAAVETRADSSTITPAEGITLSKSSSAQGEHTYAESGNYTSWRLGSYEDGRYSYSSMSYAETGQEAGSGSEVGTRNSAQVENSVSTIVNATYQEQYQFQGASEYSHVGSWGGAQTPPRTSQAVTVGDEETPDFATSISSATFSSSGSSSSSSVETSTKSHAAGWHWSLATTVRTEAKSSSFTSDAHGSKSAGQWALDSYVYDAQATAAVTLNEVGTGNSGHGASGEEIGGPLVLLYESWTASETGSSLITHHEEGTFTEGAYNLSSYLLDGIDRSRKEKNYERVGLGGSGIYYRTYDLVDVELVTHKFGTGRVGDAYGSFELVTTTTELHGQTINGIMVWTPGDGLPSTVVSSSSGNFLLTEHVLSGTATQFVPSTGTIDGGIDFVASDIGDEAAKQAVDQVNAYQIPADDLIGLLFVYAGTGAAVGLALPFAAPLLVGGGGVTTFRCLMRSALEGAVAGGIYGGVDYVAGWLDGQHAFTWGGMALSIGVGTASGALFGAGAKFLPRLGLLFTASFAVAAYEDLAAGNYWSAGWKAIGSVAAGALAKRFLSRACFVAGTPIWTEAGYRPVEAVAIGELVASRSENDPAGSIEFKGVLRTFVRQAVVVNLHLSGANGPAVIGTTGEHPFFAYGRGWADAQDLMLGDWLLTASGSWLMVEEVFRTNEQRTVYNFEVEEHHTYFVGDTTWPGLVWAHNAKYSTATAAAKKGVIYQRTDPMTGEKYVGRAKSGDHYKDRQKRHDRKLGRKHIYDVLGHYDPADLRVQEEGWIRTMGGPRTRGGPLANRRHEMSPPNYAAAGGTVPMPPPPL